MFVGPKIKMSMHLYCFDLETKFRRHYNFLYIPSASLIPYFVLRFNLLLLHGLLFLYILVCILFPLLNVTFHSRPPDHSDHFLGVWETTMALVNGFTSKLTSMISHAHINTLTKIYPFFFVQVHTDARICLLLFQNFLKINNDHVINCIIPRKFVE